MIFLWRCLMLIKKIFRYRFITLDDLETHFSVLLNDFYLLINNANLYNIKFDRILILELYDQLLLFKHPFFLNI